MTFHAVETNPIAIGELHDLEPDDFTGIIVEVSRRNEPGANRFSGVKFLTREDPVAQFETVDEALSFIDALHMGGIPLAVTEQLGSDIDERDILEALHFTLEEVNPDEYFERTGITDPFNLEITPLKKYTREIELEDPELSEAEADVEVDTAPQV